MVYLSDRMGFMKKNDELSQLKEDFSQLQSENAEISQLKNAFLRMQTENFELSESLANVSMMIDNQGWNPTYDTQESGLDLASLKSASAQLRELVVGNPLLKRGAKLRSSYVWSRGMGLPKMTSQMKNKVYSSLSERYLFSAVAWEELELAAYTDGNIFVLIDSKKAPMRVSLEEVTAVMTDPDNNEVIWAVRREWTQRNNASADKKVVRWYYTDAYTGRIGASIVVNGKAEPVDTNKTMFYHGFNRQIGWTFGVPDALPVLAWAKLYREFLENGTIMTKALAQFAYKVSSKTRAGVNNAAAKIAVADGGVNRVGATAAMGADTDLLPMPRAGAGYDFDAGKPIAAMIASGLEVSIVALLSDPGSSGAYGTAQTLDTPTQKAMESRQQSWSLFYKRVLRNYGMDADVEITWPSIETEPTHRMVQALAMAWETGTLNKEEYRKAILDILDITPVKVGAPEGIMIPNNVNFIQTKTNDGTDVSNDTVTPGQGQSGTVGALDDGDNQLRDQNL